MTVDEVFSRWLRECHDVGEATRRTALELGAPERSDWTMAELGALSFLRWRLTGVTPDCVPTVAEALTPREREVLDLLAEGLRNAEIAERLHVSPHTVRTHVAAVMGKLGAHTRAHAVAIALGRARPC